MSYSISMIYLYKLSLCVFVYGCALLPQKKKKKRWRTISICMFINQIHGSSELWAMQFIPFSFCDRVVPTFMYQTIPWSRHDFKYFGWPNLAASIIPRSRCLHPIHLSAKRMQANQASYAEDIELYASLRGHIPKIKRWISGKGQLSVVRFLKLHLAWKLWLVSNRVARRLVE